MFKFDQPLKEALIIKRKNRFIMEIKIKEENYLAHCPTTGRIGDLVLENICCLVSENDNPNRKTKFTVEAISLNSMDTLEKKWIGINQNAVNRYVEFFIKEGAFNSLFDTTEDVKREVKLGQSKLDFLVDSTYVEVKTPLQTIQQKIPDWIKRKKMTPFNSTERFAKHIQELAISLADHEKAILLTCFLYDNPGFIVEPSENYEVINKIVRESLEKGVELWQVNFEISHDGVFLNRFNNISEQFK
ncbi:DNA/RNA nuclease SfsA [Shouchella miscanthi]|uniref:DNA/RNA nuclease SfsA n=1 Tax=Shouchella miscanthi TaxID=2598861 RepID=UPI0011A9438A|nr:DNA/RNA nuclease SfsA [Shouchella miscanthi]